MTRDESKQVLLASTWRHGEVIKSIARHVTEAGFCVDFQMCITGQVPRNWQGAGILAVSVHGDALEQFLVHAQCPVVIIGLNPGHLDFPKVGDDYVVTGEMAAHHFIEQGFKSYAFYSRNWTKLETLRCRAFEQALEKDGYSCMELIGSEHMEPGRNTWIHRHGWLRNWLTRLPKPLAVFAPDDLQAIEVVQACMAESLLVPDDVAIMGVGNSTVYDENIPVPLSSIAIDWGRIMKEACRILQALIEGQPAPRDPVLVPPKGIVIRQSTETISARTPEVAKAIRFMFDHLQDEIGVPDIVRVSGVSQTHLYAAFKEEMEQSPVAVLTRIRVDKAKRMLQQTDAKVQTVAEACGFKNARNLRRCFMRGLGASPLQVREALRTQWS